MVLIGAPSLGAQLNGGCGMDRFVSTAVGAGLGAAAGAIPATIVHRHDQTTSHRIVIGSVAVGAVIGLLSAGRDRVCTSPMDSTHVADAVLSARSRHTRNGSVAGFLIGGILGAAGGTLYQIGCVRDPCNGTRDRIDVMLFSAGEGAVAGVILGSLIGWAWPVGR
ncbi:MAG TPA: hypothetical protein VN706_13200 [Gemmatimonadaceae bacterium]|nr:hypothetical protein [Gemmatimonadaceae bacterium]